MVGDLEGNLERALNTYRAASSAGVDLVVFPELTITGYPPEDLLLKSAFIKRSSECLEEFASKTTNTVAVIGFPESSESLMNSAAVCAGGSIIGIYRKHLLPNYSVFDEQRYFAAEVQDGPLFVVAGIRVGVTICEDAWSETGPILSQAAGGAELIVNLNASPYYSGRVAEREAMLITRAAEAGVPIVYTNLLGGQDELVFDGSSMIVDENGVLIARAAQFVEELLVADLQVPIGAERRDVKRPERDPLAEVFVSAESIGTGSIGTGAIGTGSIGTGSMATPQIHPLLSPTHEVFEALVLGTRDYVRKNGFSEVVIGLSGGIDSSIVAVIAVEALGADSVHGVLMPSRWSSPGSLTDAAALADALRIKTRTIPIEAAHAAFESLLTDSFTDRLPDLTEENLQARVRGTLLMALSNKFGWMVLTTGNKSEMATGYSTLYGDMAGGFAVIKDVAKMLVFELCRDLNDRKGRDVIPASVLSKPPSAELRPDQKDEDSLPPYAILDRVIEAYVERDLSLVEIEAEGFDRAVIEQVIRLVDRSEYKRRQSPPGVRVTPKAFGKDRRLPITNRWYG